MSRGRARHHANRRRMYSARQRELRERRLQAARVRDDRDLDEMTAFEIEDTDEAETSLPVMPLGRGATAA